MNYSNKREVNKERHQSGVVLVVVLIMLVVIGGVAAAAMKNAINADLVSNSARLESLATQAAQIALRYCETQFSSGEITEEILKPDENVPNWSTLENWAKDSKKIHTVNADHMKSKDSSFTPSEMPQCMVEDFNAAVSNHSIVIITARGFSPDYREKNGVRTAGSVVWLQSILSAVPIDIVVPREEDNGGEFIPAPVDQ